MIIKKTVSFLFLTLIIILPIKAPADQLSEAAILICQDQADNFGNGFNEDSISELCMNSFKKMASSQSHILSTNGHIHYYGHKNMILIEKDNGQSTSTKIIAGSSTELKSIIALSLDEKNKELIVLEESGDVLFFTTTLTGNIAPYRILKHIDLVGASEIQIDSERGQVVINNTKNNKILFFSRLANSNGRKGHQNREILKTIDTSSLNLINIMIDQKKSELQGFDFVKKQNIIFKLN